MSGKSALWRCSIRKLPFAIAVNVLWDTPWWHATARQIMGV